MPTGWQGRNGHSVNQDVPRPSLAERLEPSPEKRAKIRHALMGAPGLIISAVLATICANRSGEGEPTAVLAAIPVTHDVNAIAVSPNAVWVAGSNTRTVTRIDPATSKEVATVSLPDRPGDVAATEGAVWVTNLREQSVLRIDSATNTVASIIRIGPMSGELVVGEGAVWVGGYPLARIDPQTNRATRFDVVANDVAVGAGAVWVTNNSTNTVSRVNPTSGKVVATSPLGTGPHSVAGGDAGVWVTTGNNVSRLDPGSGAVVSTVAVETPPADLAVAQSGVWVAGEPLRRIDLTTNVVTTPMGEDALAAGVAVGLGDIWFTGYGNEARYRDAEYQDDVVYRIDPRRLGR